MANVTEPTCKREHKHIVIVEAISRLESNLNLLEDLIRSIGGEGLHDEPDKPTEANPSLSNFLDRTADELNILSDRLSKDIEELNVLLF